MARDDVIEVSSGAAFRAPSGGMVTLTHLIYGLHAVAVIVGIVGAATIVGSFVFGLPSIIAVVLNYLNRGAVRGTYLDSHFGWQIRTFWFALLWSVLMALLIVTIIGIPFALLGLGITGLWVIYRVVRGWLALKEARTVP